MAGISCLAPLFTRVSRILLLGAGAVVFLLVQPGVPEIATISAYARS